MIRRFRGLRAVALAWSLTGGLCVPAVAQEAGTRAGAIAPAASAPFWVAGVVIGPARRSAILVPLDDARREQGIVTLLEGQSYNEYRLVTVEPARVVLEANGTLVSLGIGRPYSGPRGAPGAGPRAATGPIFTPGPDKPRPDVEYMGRQIPRGGGAEATSAGARERPPDTETVQNFVERVFGHPKFQQQIEEIRPLIRQRMDRTLQDGQPSSPPASSPSSEGPSR